MAQSSSGCQTCKIRRIKCDGTKPVCARCTKSRRICLETSAVKAACFSINIENKFASGIVKRPRGPRSSLTLWRPQIDLPTRAVAYYMKYHLQLPKSAPLVLGGLVECVSAWQTSGRTSPMVDLAISSIALAVFSKTQHHPLAMAEADATYCRSLRATQACIKQISGPTSRVHLIDACLLATFMMGRYEGVIHCSNNASFKGSFGSMRSWFHHDGSMAVLKEWYDGADRQAVSTIVKQTRRGLIKSTILRELPLPDWMVNGADFGEDGLDLDFDRIVVRLTTIRGRLVSCRSWMPSQTESFRETSDELEDLDRRLQVWITQVSNVCRYQQHVLVGTDDRPVKHLYSPVVYSFSRPDYAGLWAQYFSTRLLLNSTLLVLLNTPLFEVGDHLDTQNLKQQCLVQMQEMSDSLASTVPFCLGKLKCGQQVSSRCELTSSPDEDEDIQPHAASLLVWPLTIASSISGINSGQLGWFKSELASMGCITGDGILEYAVTDHWAVL